MNGTLTSMVPRTFGGAVSRGGNTPASQVLRTQTETTAKNLMKTRAAIIEQVAKLQVQLGDVETSLAAAFDLMSKIDREGMAQRIEMERLESEAADRDGSGTGND